MNVHFGFEAWHFAGPAVATLGNFDGVHLGHQVILRRLIEESAKLDVPAVVITFDPVPRKVLTPGNAPPLIQTLEQRLECFESLDIHNTIVVAFNHEFARKTPEDFVRQYLVNALKIRAFVVGENFAFGHRKSGDLNVLRKLGTQHGFEVQSVAEVRSGEARVSSTRIRELIVSGQVKDAAKLLGRAFTLRGTVAHGEQLGGKLGIPTANLLFDNELVPGRGVYVSSVRTAAGKFHAATNVGIRPTVGGTRLVIESHLIDFAGDLYDQKVDVQFLDRVRDEKKFNGIEELKNQIHKDIESVRNYFS